MNIIINKNNSMFPTFLESSVYKKGDRIYLTPHNENQQTFSGTRTNFMGKQITYSATTTATEYPFRIRATVDNPRDPYSPGVFGTDWVCDEPHAIVEEGSNSNGSYVMYAGGKIEELSNTVSGVSSGSNWGFIHDVRLPVEVKSVLERHLTQLQRDNNTPNGYMYDAQYDGPSRLNIFQVRGVVANNVDRQYSARGYLAGTWY